MYVVPEIKNQRHLHCTQRSAVQVSKIKNRIAVVGLIILLAGCAAAPTITPAPTIMSAPTIEVAAPDLPTRTAEPLPTSTSTPRPLPTITPTSEAASAYYKVGVRAYGTGDYAAALINFTHALQLDSKNALIYMSRAATYQALNDLDNAIADYSRVIQLDRRNASACHSPQPTNARSNIRGSNTNPANASRRSVLRWRAGRMTGI